MKHIHIKSLTMYQRWLCCYLQDVKRFWRKHHAALILPNFSKPKKVFREALHPSMHTYGLFMDNLIIIMR